MLALLEGLVGWFGVTAALNDKVCNIPSLNSTEEIRYVPSRRIRFGIGAVPDLDSEQTPHPRCLSLSTLCAALQTLSHPWQSLLQN